VNAVAMFCRLFEQLHAEVVAWPPSEFVNGHELTMRY